MLGEKATTRADPTVMMATKKKTAVEISMLLENFREPKRLEGYLGEIQEDCFSIKGCETERRRRETLSLSLLCGGASIGCGKLVEILLSDVNFCHEAWFGLAAFFWLIEGRHIGREVTYETGRIVTGAFELL